MATANNAYGVDPTDPYNQVRQRMMAQQQYQDPTAPADPSTVPSRSAASPDFAQPMAVQDFASRPSQTPVPTTPAPAPTAAPTTPDTTTARTAPPTATQGPNPPGSSAQPGAGQPQAPAAAAPPKPPSYDDVNAAYQKYLGRPLTQQEYGQFYNWSGNPSDAQRNWEWTISHSPEAQAYAAAHPAPAGAGAAGVTGAVTPGTNPFNDQIRQLIMKQLATAGGPVDPNNPEIASTLSAARDEASRQTDQERAALAERLYAQGIGTGGTGTLGSNELTQQIQQSGERNAGALSTLRGQLLMNEYNQKNTQLQNLLQLAVTSGDTQSAQAIQAQIANLQAAIQREGLGVNLGEFSAALNQNAALAGLNG